MSPTSGRWHFDIDRHLNPWIPPPPWRYLPYPVARFLGFRRRKPQQQQQQQQTGNLVAMFWAFIGIMAAILVIQAVSQRVPSFEARGAPMIVGSFVRQEFLAKSNRPPLPLPFSAVCVYVCVVG